MESVYSSPVNGETRSGVRGQGRSVVETEGVANSRPGTSAGPLVSPVQSHRKIKLRGPLGLLVTASDSPTFIRYDGDGVLFLRCRLVVLPPSNRVSPTSQRDFA